MGERANNDHDIATTSSISYFCQKPQYINPHRTILRSLIRDTRATNARKMTWRFGVTTTASIEVAE